MLTPVRIVDYGASNIRSITNAVSYLGYDPKVISHRDQVDDVSQDSPIVLPGVGRFASAIDELTQRDLKDWMIDVVTNQGVPILGICLGFHLIMRSSAESPGVAGLGLVPSEVVALEDCGWEGPVPRVGFVAVTSEADSVLHRSLAPCVDVYFCHSFGISSDSPYVTSRTGTNLSIGSTIEYGNIFGTQFHPEKSQQSGLDILQNFFELP